MPIIYYDGNCVYCFNYTIWLIRHGLPKTYQFAQLQGRIGQQLAHNYPETQQYDSVILQEGSEFKYYSDAIKSILLALPVDYKGLGLGLSLFPKTVRDVGYKTFANNRDKMWKTHWQHATPYEETFYLDRDENTNLNN
ncbi:thiol-disulfide oxidoreductase DCC family protein [Staphylococcus auricularis]|uniref:DUF393 domain-containing protein n=1 Tax=Staphylococcus auricularis TaxID=29379 RepID=A0ABX5IIF2_9STAP|nr:DCC1-like thiol-disulfide oxidoreductase family protein [Staphylococcus auricularis]MCE5039247.1 DUF393 domain-containing protein [Staphylococcus auricularis]MEB6570955.1 DCC1-like thiol-disulfide oxidoreductase family protein [Staphylococcus auricularis]PTH19439.1 hypothetical protein BU607_01380 [Staphylococcus auricularis]PTH26685.1 hypothetical protein BU608_03535 [Staphylococcus auricularis]